MSARLSYRQTRTRDGYVTLASTSDATATITGGIITLAKPTITGTPVVDQVLTATSGTVSPDAAVAFVWRVDGQDASTGDTYTVRPADVGKPVTVAATATRTDYDPTSTTSDPTAAVTQAVFATAPTAAFSGVLRVAETLTADEGAASPAPDAYRYQWLADGKPVAGATKKTFTVTPAQKDATMSVSVTAVRAGYVDAADTSAISAPVVTNLAPGLTLSPSARELRLGQPTTLTWTSEDAITVDASGAWSGARARAGSETLQPSATGTATYVLTATNGSGTTTAQVAVPVSLPPTTLTVTSARKVVSGKKLSVKARGLAGREAYTVRIGGTVVATGTTSSTGKVSRSVRVPRSLDGGKVTVRVTGSLTDRTGSRRLRIVKPRALKIVLDDRSVRASDDQVVTVRRLRPRERVTVTYDGRRVSPRNARASRTGEYTVRFDVGTAWGPRTVVARGSISRRSSSVGFSVVNRCPGGGYYCR